jgi:hypothetical protein
MSSAHLQLAAKGQEDRWLSESPDRTYFEAKYTPRVNRSRETYEVPLDNQVKTFGMTGRCTIPVKGDYLTRLTLRAVFPPIYPTVEGEYVYPTPSSQVGGSVYANMGLTLVVADGVTLTANTVGNHYMSIGTEVTLSGTAYRIFDLDGTYTITSIPTANSFTCSTTLAGISYNGTMSFVGIACGDIISYFSTRNSNLWVNNLTNKTWQITGGSIVGSEMTFTTSAPSNFPIGSQVILNLPESSIVNGICTVTASTDTTFTCTTFNGTFVMGGSVRNPAFSRDNGMNWVYSKSVLTNDLSEPNSAPVAGDGIFLMITSSYPVNTISYSTDNGITWNMYPPSGVYVPPYIAYGNGTFVAVGSYQLYSTDNGMTWTYATISLPVNSYSVAYGNGTFVMVGDSFQAYSTDNGVTWTSVESPLGGFWISVIYGNGIFIMTAGYWTVAYSTDNGITWTYSTSLPFFSSPGYYLLAYGNGVFVAVGPDNYQAYSTDNGMTWNSATSPLTGYWDGVTYGNGVFVMSGGSEGQAYSTDNGLTWHRATSSLIGYLSPPIFGDFSYVNTPSDSVSFVVPPLQLTSRVFSSDVYPSISFANSSDAAFWGFDARNGLTYSTPAIPPWTLTQSGWVSGFLPPSLSTWDDSVAHKLVRDARILVGKQTIKEYTGEYIELQNDLTVPYENKAILKLLNGTLDQTQATTSREYYTTLPLGTKEIPLCALTHQQMSVEVDFEAFTNLSQNLNPGTGDFLNPQSYLTYDASTGLLNGEPINVQTTFSYQQYIFIVTYGGQFIVYDTTKDVADPTSYIVLSAFAGTSLFSQFCVLSGTLYIGLSNGKLLSIIIDELIQGNTSSSILNNYAPTIGILTGTIVADFRYLYYTVSNTASSNVFMTRYDTLGSFTSPGSYTTVDFTATFNSNVTGVYQTLSTGTELIMLPRGTPGTLYTYQLNANVQSQWYVLDYSSYGSQITEGVLIGSSVYFVSEGFNIIEYTNSSFTMLTKRPMIMFSDNSQAYSESNGFGWKITDKFSHGISAIGNGAIITVGFDFGTSLGIQGYYTDNGETWNSVASPLPEYWHAAAYGNGVFVMVAEDWPYEFDQVNGGLQAYSTDNGMTWTYSQNSLPDRFWWNIAYGNGTFVITGRDVQAYSTDNGVTWTYSIPPLPPPESLHIFENDWKSITYGNGVFVMVGSDLQAYSTDNGVTWTCAPYFFLPDYPYSAVQWTSLAYGNGVFVALDFGGTHGYSTDNGMTWTPTTTVLPGYWEGLAYENGVFVAVGRLVQAYSTDNGVTWTSIAEPLTSWWHRIVSLGSSSFTIPGDGFKNLIAVGNYIYASTSNIAVQIDTTQDLSTAAAYKFPAPVLPDGQYVFANGPRYIYMFSQSDPAAQNIVRFDPYPPVPLLQTSILVDYESLPPEVPKPDKALLGLVQTQKVTDMNYMNIRGPVKELWVTGTSDSTNVFQYSILSDQSTLALTAGEEIITEDVGTRTFLNTIEPFETHTSMPIRNVSVIPFEFDPESDIPNGTVNFSRIRDQVFNGGAETVWARTYNLLAIQGGIGGLIFNS